MPAPFEHLHFIRFFTTSSTARMFSTCIQPLTCYCTGCFPAHNMLYWAGPGCNSPAIFYCHTTLLHFIGPLALRNHDNRAPVETRPSPIDAAQYTNGYHGSSHLDAFVTILKYELLKSAHVHPSTQVMPPASVSCIYVRHQQCRL